MNKYLCVLLALPAIYARIEVNIVAQKDNEPQVKLYGSSVDIISDLEINTFKLGDNNLKRSTDQYFGKRPTDAYLKSPTPWGDLYRSYNWPQVTRILSPQRARVLSLKNEPSIISTQIFENNSTRTMQVTANIVQEVANTISNTWDKSGELSVRQDISYEFDMEVFKVGGTTSFGYTSKWGESTTKSQTVTVGSASGVTLTLEPEQKVIAELYATKGSMRVQVDYEANLSGSVAVNYKNPYKGHHFWALNVNSVMDAGNLERTVESTEIIDLGYYSESRVVVRDYDTMQMIYTIPVPMM